jgi:hypothetical protein
MSSLKDKWSPHWTVLGDLTACFKGRGLWTGGHSQAEEGTRQLSGSRKKRIKGPGAELDCPPAGKGHQGFCLSWAQDQGGNSASVGPWGAIIAGLAGTEGPFSPQCLLGSAHVTVPYLQQQGGCTCMQPAPGTPELSVSHIHSRTHASHAPTRVSRPRAQSRDPEASQRLQPGLASRPHPSTHTMSSAPVGRSPLQGSALSNPTHTWKFLQLLTGAWTVIEGVPGKMGARVRTP